MAAEDESLLVTGRGLPEPDPPGSPYQTQAASGPASSSGPLIVPLGVCLMHYNESPGAPRWPGGGSDSAAVVPPPALSLSVTHKAGSTAAPSMSVMWFHNVFVFFIYFFVIFYTSLTAALTLSAVVISKSEN